MHALGAEVTVGQRMSKITRLMRHLKTRFVFARGALCTSVFVAAICPMERNQFFLMLPSPP